MEFSSDLNICYLTKGSGDCREFDRPLIPAYCSDIGSDIVAEQSRFSPDQTGNPLRPKVFPWVGSGA
ncbi:hypothetical protein GQ457_01G013320 [Hibiscus cannabinus]